MKVLGQSGDRFKQKYICEITHSELSKFFNIYSDMEKLSIGDEIDLGTGYDFKSDIESALRTTKEFIRKNQKTVNAIMNGLTVVSKKTKGR
jgi:hypothetical protein